MPSLAAFHPQIVHFVVALLFLGVVLRIVSLTRWLRFSGPAAAMLLLIGTGAAVLAVRSGTDAHGPVERIPGARPLVAEHEEQGETTRNIFLGVAAIEILALVFARRDATLRYARYAHFASALVGVVGSFMLYEAAEHGGELVYSYGAGPGLRTGNPEDVERLLVAGLYNQAQVERRAGRGDQSAALIDELARRRPADTTVKFLRVESLLRDRRDPRAALTAAESISVAPNDPRMAPRKATLLADAYLALGKPDSARAALAPAIASFPANTRLKAKLDSIRAD